MTEYMKDLWASLVVATSSVAAIQPYLNSFDAFFDKVKMTIKEVDDMFEQADMESSWTEHKKRALEN